MSRMPSAVTWRKSTRCESSMCVEVASIDGQAAMRDSTDPDVHLVFDASQWSAFLTAVKAGEFDHR
jgi:hypothetical protein